ncbi:MAG: protease pro-enzyme activation domain-containing protein, partial [Burkholderiaceae bacterium]
MPKSRQARRLCSLVAIVAAHFLLALPAAAITPPKLITQALDETRLFTLQGNTHPAMRAENDRGRVDDSLLLAHLQLQLQRSPEQEQALKQLIDQQHDPASPNYHRWLTPTTFGSQYGLAKEDIKTITGWLASHGMTVHSVHPSSMVIDFSATAGQIRNTFKTEIHSLLVAGVPHIANASDPQIPAALAPAVAGVVSMHDFTPRTKKWPQNQFTVGTGGTYNITPADLATIYNLNPLFNGGYSGQGQTITIIMDSNLYSVSDWTTFRSTFGLSSYTAGSFTTIHPAAASGTNNCNDPGVTASDGESIVDAEWASAAAPSAAI